MSKSKFNGTDSWEYFARGGADDTRADLLFLGQVETELQWEEEEIIGMSCWFDKLWPHTSMLGEKLTEPGFPTLPSLIACPLTLMSILPEDHDLFSLLRETHRNIPFALSTSLTVNAFVLNLTKPINLFTPPRAEAWSTLTTTYCATGELLPVLAPI